MPSLNADSPFGSISVVERDGAIVRLDWSPAPDWEETPVLVETRRQLAAYFAGDLKTFDLPLDPKGPALHQAVFKAMREIPYGETRTYRDLAKELGTYGQPIGQACGANPIPIIIPCHRILSANGLGGYSGDGGLETKIALLKLEGAYPFLV